MSVGSCGVRGTGVIAYKVVGEVVVAFDLAMLYYNDIIANRCTPYVHCIPSFPSGDTSSTGLLLPAFDV